MTDAGGGGDRAVDAAVRAGESDRPDRLFEDPYARLLAGPEGFALLADVAAGRPPGAVSTGITIRTRWIDDQGIPRPQPGHRLSWRTTYQKATTTVPATRSAIGPGSRVLAAVGA